MHILHINQITCDSVTAIHFRLLQEASGEMKKRQEDQRGIMSYLRLAVLLVITTQLVFLEGSPLGQQGEL